MLSSHLTTPGRLQWVWRNHIPPWEICFQLFFLEGKVRKEENGGEGSPHFSFHSTTWVKCWVNLLFLLRKVKSRFLQIVKAPPPHSDQIDQFCSKPREPRLTTRLIELYLKLSLSTDFDMSLQHCISKERKVSDRITTKGSLYHLCALIRKPGSKSKGWFAVPDNLIKA